MIETLMLTARIEGATPKHATIGVFQNGGKAGTLVVEKQFAEYIVDHLHVVEKFNLAKVD